MLKFAFGLVLGAAVGSALTVGFAAKTKYGRIGVREAARAAGYDFLDSLDGRPRPERTYTMRSSPFTRYDQSHKDR